MSNIAKADHEILLTWREATGVLLHSPKEMRLGKTVHYSSPDGEVTIEFRDDNNSPSLSPFLNPNGSEKIEISSNEPPIMLSKTGQFVCHCFITTPNGEKFGWGPNSLQSGGNHDVQ